MSLNWSPLHEALGEGPGPITLSMIERAINERVPEGASLDWKRALPAAADGAADEFAKDVAAMANSGGGLIVYGVGEERGTGRATQLCPVEVGEGAQRRLRQLAARVRPLVTGLDPIPVTTSDTTSEGVLVLHVPASADMPHLIVQENRLGIPYRNGPETAWMTERELERAYRDRFGRSEAEQEKLGRLARELIDHLDMSRGAWLTGVASPRVVSGGLRPHLDRPRVGPLLAVARARAARISGDGTGGNSLFEELEIPALNPRVGLRRWVLKAQGLGAADELCQVVYLELHHDGSIAFAVFTEHWWANPVTGTHGVPAVLVEIFACDLVALIMATSEKRGIAAPMALRVDLIPGEPALPFAALDKARVGNHLEQPEGSRTLKRVTPILTEVAPPMDVETSRRIAAEIALDVLNQFGMTDLRVLPG